MHTLYSVNRTLIATFSQRKRFLSSLIFYAANSEGDTVSKSQKVKENGEG